VTVTRTDDSDLCTLLCTEVEIANGTLPGKAGCPSWRDNFRFPFPSVSSLIDEFPNR